MFSFFIFCNPWLQHNMHLRVFKPFSDYQLLYSSSIATLKHKQRTHVVVITIFVPILASEKEDIAVTIDVSYSKPSDFSLDPPNYRAGSSVTLTCRVEGVVASFSGSSGMGTRIYFAPQLCA